MAAFGLLDYWERRYLIRPFCEDSKHFGNKSKSRRITLDQLLGPILILIVGMGFSCVLFLLEIILFWMRKKIEAAFAI